jgi:acyl carrier protein
MSTIHIILVCLFWTAFIGSFIGLFLYVVMPMSRRSRAVQRRAAEVLHDRPSLSAEEFGQTLFPPEQSAIATWLRKTLEEILIVDASRIRPDDRLIDDLGFGQVDGMDPNFLEFEVEREYGVKLRPAWASVKTGRDLVTYIYRAQAASGN